MEFPAEAFGRIGTRDQAVKERKIFKKIHSGNALPSNEPGRARRLYRINSLREAITLA
ncbi:hypothetical protein [Bosea sp. NBC_00550]|uniref:hypothetical protein n=1 Tax=Bosea sp. NBC_00550 TaxID=2969621 RepID=UPI0022313CBF|nr:hypothetical protein [Bosea sp. NBC_00550]UZF91838.1 hypothetical protein NWE53_22475 [Bosea sp. NBC_00550]